MIELERTDLGQIAVEPHVLDGLVEAALAGIEGVRPARGRHHLRVAEHDGSVQVEVAVSVAGGLVLPAVGEEVRARVAGVLEAALGSRPERVDVSIESVHVEARR